MNVPQIDTTNLLLGVMVGVTLLELAVLIVLGVWAVRQYSRLRHLQRQWAGPAGTRLNRILDDVESLVQSGRAAAGHVEDATRRVVSVSETVERVDQGIRASFTEAEAINVAVRQGLRAFFRRSSEGSNGRGARVPQRAA